MKMFTFSSREASILSISALALLAAPLANAAGIGQLGILNTSGTNPATGSEWQVGDTYHLFYITTGTTEATSTDIATYNTFVQNDAASQTGAFANMGNVTWNVFGSTATVNAVDNAVISGSVVNAFDSANLAADATSFWDLAMLNGNAVTTVGGSPANIHSGTEGGGIAQVGNELGAVDEQVRIAWSAWTDWNASWRTEATTDLKALGGISEALQVQAVPEASTGLLLGLTGLALLRRRR